MASDVLSGEEVPVLEPLRDLSDQKQMLQCENTEGKVVSPEGIEPATNRLRVCCSAI